MKKILHKIFCLLTGRIYSMEADTWYIDQAGTIRGKWPDPPVEFKDKLEELGDLI